MGNFMATKTPPKPELITASGCMVDLVNPDPASFMLDDIAVGLAHEGRWANQSRPWYSVAQHCIRVADQLNGRDGNNKLAAAGLMHDAHEFLLRDVGTPFKAVLSGYVLYATRMQDAIHRRFGLNPSVGDYAAIAAVDASETHHEAISFMPASWTGVTISPRRLAEGTGIIPMTAKQAYRVFLDRAKRYGVIQPK